MNSRYLANFEALKAIHRDLVGHGETEAILQWAIDVIEAAEHLVDSRSWPRHDSDINDLRLRLETYYGDEVRRLRSL